MTTNHRPTLESKRGRDIAIKDTIQHSRSGKGQTTLKFRSDIPGAQIDHARGRLAFQELESERKRHKKIEENPGNDSRLPVDTKSQNVVVGETNEKASVRPISDDESGSQETKETAIEKSDSLESGKHKESENLKGSDLDSESSDASESEDDDTEQLMKELEKVRQEKASRNKETVLASNPLISLDGNDTINKKKSWRGSSAFSRMKLSTDKSFTTDTLSSDTHKQFLSKYFK